MCPTGRRALWCRLASRAMAVTNQVSANEVMSGGDLAKQYKSELSQLRNRLSRQESREDHTAATLHLRQQVCQPSSLVPPAL